MTDETNDPQKSNSARVDASRGGIARRIKRLPPGEHLVELGARVVPDQILRIAAYSVELQAGTFIDLDKIFGPSPTDARGKRAYAAQGSFWLSLLTTCGLADDELQDITLDELAAKIHGNAIAVISEAGYWSRVRPL